MKAWKIGVVTVLIAVWYAICYFVGRFIGGKLGEWLAADMA